MSLADINTLALEEYRKTWKGAAGTRARRQVRLSHVLKYCVKYQWMQQNFATEISKIKVPDSPKLPFTREEFERTIEAASWRRQRAVAMLLLLRWSGLRTAMPPNCSDRNLPMMASSSSTRKRPASRCIFPCRPAW